jgi:type II secretory pathway component PulF
MTTLAFILGEAGGPNYFGWWSLPFSLFCYALFFLLPMGCLVVLTHKIFSLPLRRRERARFFLDLIETALDRGQSVEHAIVSAAESRDPALGVRFHLLAAYLESGLRLGAALEKVPRFLPPQISAMLRAGEKLGDLKRVLPACREVLRDPPAAVRSAMNYLVAVLLAFSPVAIYVMIFLTFFVFPKFREVFAGMGVLPPAFARLTLSHTGWLVGFEALVFLLVILATLIYIGGTHFIRWFQFQGLPFVDWTAWRIPWKQKRLQRTFSAMLAVLLDGGVPEAEAVRLAGDCTVNEVCHHRTRLVLAALEQGIKLDDAVRAFDDHGEFHWRLTNAIHAHGGFLNALRGWHEALDAKAFQQEEATAHVVTSGLVILNGVLVALVAMTVFGTLIAMVEALEAGL